MEKVVDNIRAMERVLNEGTAAMGEALRGLEKLSALETDLQELFAYYGSPAWFADRDRDSRGELPQTLPRGVLTEDAVYDLLTDLMRLRTQTQELCGILLPEEQENEK